MLPLHDFTFVVGLTDVGHVSQYPLDVDLIESVSGPHLAALAGVQFAMPAALIGLFGHLQHRLHLEVQTEQTLDNLQLHRIQRQALTVPVDIVTEDRRSSREFPSATGGARRSASCGTRLVDPAQKAVTASTNVLHSLSRSSKIVHDGPPSTQILFRVFGRIPLQCDRYSSACLSSPGGARFRPRSCR